MKDEHHGRTTEAIRETPQQPPFTGCAEPGIDGLFNFPAPTAASADAAIIAINRALNPAQLLTLTNQLAADSAIPPSTSEYLALSCDYCSRNRHARSAAYVARTVLTRRPSSNAPRTLKEVWTEFGTCSALIQQKRLGATIDLARFEAACDDLPTEAEQHFWKNRIASLFPSASTPTCGDGRLERDALQTLLDHLTEEGWNALESKLDPTSLGAIRCIQNEEAARIPAPKRVKGLGIPSLPRDFYETLETLANGSESATFLRFAHRYHPCANMANAMLLRPYRFYTSRNTWNNYKKKWVSGFEAAQQADQAFSVPMVQKIRRHELLALLVRCGADFATADRLLSVAGYRLSTVRTAACSKMRDLDTEAASFFCANERVRNDICIQDDLLNRLSCLYVGDSEDATMQPGR